jgi:hypothetical protein
MIYDLIQRIGQLGLEAALVINVDELTEDVEVGDAGGVVTVSY